MLDDVLLAALEDPHYIVLKYYGVGTEKSSAALST